jgi:hypothetical protein
MPLGLGLMMGLGHNVAASGGGGAAWTPASLTGLKFWGDANQQSESADAAVATFVDRSGNSNDFTQATGASQPLLRFASINGKKALEFDRTNDYLSCATGLMNGATAGAWFAVMKVTTDPPPGGLESGAVLNGFGTSGNDSHHPFSDGNIYDTFGTDTRKTCGDPTPSLASVALIGATSASAYYGGLIAEVVIMNAVPSAGDIASLVAYVNTKYGTSF